MGNAQLTSRIEQLQAAVDKGADMAQMSAHLLGDTPAEVAALLAGEWRFSDELVAGLRYQDSPTAAQPESAYAKVLCMAKMVLDGWEERPEAEQTSWLAKIADDLGRECRWISTEILRVSWLRRRNGAAIGLNCR